MAGNRKFHNKFHSANHHTLPSPHIKDSGLDPIASHEFPFMGDYVICGLVSASNNYLLNGPKVKSTNLDTVPFGLPAPTGWNVFRDSMYVDGDVTITGNLTALGELTYLHTQVHATSATEVEVWANNSNGKSTGLLVDQHGTNDIVHIKNDGNSSLLMTGSADNPGWIGINLAALEAQNITLPNQRMTIVGSVSVVPDTGELADQLGQKDPGMSGSLYIEGGLHVNDKTFLDQTTIDTTDGKFYVSGNNNDKDANIFDVDVPTELDKTTVDTTDDKFYVHGTGTPGTENPLDVDVPTFLDKTTVDTTDGKFYVHGDDNDKHANIFDVDVPTELDKLTVDTTDDDMLVTGSNTLDVDVPSDFEELVDIDELHVDTTDGDMVVSGSNTLDVDVPSDFEELVDIDELHVDTTDGDMVVSGSNTLDVDVPSDFDEHVQMDQVTVDTHDGHFNVITTGDDNNFIVDVHTELDQVTVDTNDGPFQVLTTGTNNVFDVDVPTLLDKTTVDTNDGDFLIKTTGEWNILDVDVKSDFNEQITAKDIYVTIPAASSVRFDGDGKFVADNGLVDLHPLKVVIKSITDIDTGVGQLTIKNTEAGFWPNRNKAVFEVPTLFDSLTANAINMDVRLTGSQKFVVDIRSIFNDDVDFNGTVNANGQLNVKDLTVYGTTSLQQTTIDTSNGNLLVQGTGDAEFTTPIIAYNNVHIKGDLTVDGNAYLSAGEGGLIYVGDVDSDNVVFRADVSSDVLPNIDGTYDLGSESKRWSHIHSVSSTAEYMRATKGIFVDGSLDVDGKTTLDETAIDTTDGSFVVSGDNRSHIYTDLSTYGQVSALGGPWVFGACDLTKVAPHGTVDFDTVQNAWEYYMPPHPFQVDCNALFQAGLTARGPVQIGELPDGVVDEMAEPTFEILGNAHLREGNLKIVSDIRHLEDENTLIRFSPDKLEFRVGDAGMLTLTEKPSADGTDLVEIGGPDENVDFKLWRKSETTEPGLYFDSDTGDIEISGSVGIGGANEAKDVIGDGLDVQGSARVTDTLSAGNLIVDYLTVQKDSFGNVGQGGHGGGAAVSTMSGVALSGAYTDEYINGETISYLGTETGIKYDVLNDSQGDIQKLYCFTIVALSGNDDLGIHVGDTQSTTYQFAPTWDEYYTQAHVHDVEYGIIHTSANPLASISSVVLSATDVPTSERIVKIVIRPDVDCEFYVHNVLEQTAPKVLDTITTGDFKVKGDLSVFGSTSAAQDLTVSGPTTLLSSTTFEDDTVFNAPATFNDTVDINAPTNIKGLTVDENVYIKGNLRVDGNAYLSAGTSGVINVGDTDGDNVVFNADVDSNITPNIHRTYDIGSRQAWWREGYIWDTYVDTISSPSFYTAITACKDQFDGNAWTSTDNISSVDGSDPYIDGGLIRISETSDYHKSDMPDALYDEEEKIFDTGGTVELSYTSDRVALITTNSITLDNTTVSDYPVGSRLLLITTYAPTDTTKDSVGNWEYVTVESHNGDKELILKDNIIKDYSAANYTFVAKPPRYKKLVVEQGTTLTGPKWTGDDTTLQGVVTIIADTAEIRGTIDMTGKGYRGGDVHKSYSNSKGGRGESYHGGIWNVKNRYQALGGGGGGNYGGGSTGGDVAGGGGGGGHGTDGTNGSTNQRGYKGQAFGEETFETRIFMGPGGGQGGTDSGSPYDTHDARGGYGGSGGGIIILDSMYTKIESTGIVNARGGNGFEAYDYGNAEPGNGGGGAGGSIVFTGDLNNAGTITSRGGIGYKADGSGATAGGYGNSGGDGGSGRMAVQGRLIGAEPVYTAFDTASAVQKVGESISNILSAVTGQEYDINVDVAETDSPLMVMINDELVGFAVSGNNVFTLSATQELNEVILRKTTTGDTLIGIHATVCPYLPHTVFTGPVTAEYDVQINGNLDVWGYQTLTGDLDVGGDTILYQDLDVVEDTTLHGKLNVSGASHFDDTVTIEGVTQINDNTFIDANLDVTGSVTISGTTEVADDIHGRSDLTIDGDTYLSGGLIVDQDTVLNSNLHVKGDVRVDGNAYLSAGTDGVINVGDKNTDNVVFHADVDSDIVPDDDVTYSLGTTAQRWMDLNVEDVSATGRGYFAGHDFSAMENQYIGNIQHGDKVSPASQVVGGYGTYTYNGSPEEEKYAYDGDDSTYTGYYKCWWSSPNQQSKVWTTYTFPTPVTGTLVVKWRLIAYEHSQIEPERGSWKVQWRESSTANWRTLRDLSNHTASNSWTDRTETLDTGSLPVYQVRIWQHDIGKGALAFAVREISTTPAAGVNVPLNPGDSPIMRWVLRDDQNNANDALIQHLLGQQTTAVTNASDIYGEPTILSFNKLQTPISVVVSNGEAEEETVYLYGHGEKDSVGLPVYLGNFTNTHANSANVTLNEYIKPDEQILIVDGDTELNGDVAIQDNLTVGGNTNFEGTLDVARDTILHQNLTVYGHVATITGRGEFSSAVNIQGPTHVNNTLDVTDFATVSGTLDVGGDVHGYSDLTIDGDTYLSGGLIVGDKTTLKDDLHVEGNLQVDVTASINDDLTVSGNTTVSGDTVLHSTLQVDDDATFDSNVHIKGDLRVDGNAYLSGGESGYIHVGDSDDDIVAFQADVGSDILPDVTETFNLGSADKSWNHVHWSGGNSILSNSVYNFINTTSGDSGFANLSAYKDNRFVLRHDQVPDLAITQVHRVSNSSLVVTLQKNIFRGDIVLIEDTHDNLIAIADHPTGEYDPLAAEYVGYEKLFAPPDMVRFINGKSGPSVTFTTDDFNDTDTINKFVNVGEKTIWNSVYASVTATSADWNSVYTSVNDTSGEWDSVYTSVEDTSADWNSVYASVTATSADWNSVYTSVNDTSGDWNSVYTSVEDTSADWNSVYTSVNDTSGDWNSVYTSVNDTSADWNSVYTSVNDTSGEWNSVYTTVNSHSSVFTEVENTSGDWNSVYTSVNDTSADWNSVYTSVNDTSGDWNSVYTTVNSHSSVFTEVENTSADWNSVYTSVNDTSADWNSVYTSVNDTSAEWDSVYSFVNSDSATNNTDYNQSTFVNASGDTITGDLTVSGDTTLDSTLSVTGDTTMDSALSVSGHTTLNTLNVSGVTCGNAVIEKDLHVKGDLRVDGTEISKFYTNVSETSGDWNSVYSSVNITSGEWDSVYTSVNDTSGDWNSVYSSVNITSGEWDSVYSFINTTSGGEGFATLVDGKLDESQVPNLSITDTHVVTNNSQVSALCDGSLLGPKDIQVGDLVIVTDMGHNLIAMVDHPAGTYNKGFDTFNGFTKLVTPTDYIQSVNGKHGHHVILNPDDLDDTNTAHKFVTALQRDQWDSTYATVCATSADWNSVYTSVNETSGEWNSVYSFVNSDSATNNTDYNQSTFVNASGDTMTGDLLVSANLGVSSTLSVSGDTTLDSTLSVLGNTTVSGDTVLHSTLQVDDSATFDSNVHIKGDLRVDGNAYLSAGADGVINVGDSDTDSVTFHADIDSTLIPDKNDTYSLGTSAKKWSIVHSESAAFGVVDVDVANVHEELNVFGVTTLSGKSHEGPGVIITGTPTGITDVNTPGFEDRDGDYMIPDVDITGDVVLHGSLSADEAHIFSLTASNFKAEYQRLVINDGDLELWNGNIRQRGGNVLVEGDIAHIDDENTYIRFEPDSIEFRTHDQRMIQLNEYPFSRDIIKFGDEAYNIDLKIQNNIDENTFFVDSYNAYVGIGTDTPTEKFHVYTGQTQLADGDQGGAFMIGAGTTDQRVDKRGSIRWNTDLNRYEGYLIHDDTWASLNSIGDTDGDTYIDVDAGSYTDSDRMAFYTVGCSAMTIYPNQTVAFAGDIQFDNITVYDTNSVTGPLTATSEFLYLKVNGKDRAIRLWTTPEDTREDIETFHGESIAHIGDECGLGLGGQIPTQTISAQNVLFSPPTQ